MPLVTLALTGVASSAQASDEIFRPNPLTNSTLDEQAEADDLKYGGELEPGDAGNMGKTDAYPKLKDSVDCMSSTVY
jgi:hypothetical protein